MLRIKKKHIQIMQIMFVILLNLLSTKWNFLGILIGLTEWLVIYFCIFKKKYENAFLILIISMATSFDINSFVYYNEETRILFSIYMMPYLSNIFFVFSALLILFTIYLKYKNNFFENVRRYKNIYTLLKFIIIIIFTGILFGIFGYILNDNGVHSTDWYLKNYMRVTIQYLGMISIIVTTTILLVANTYYHKIMANLLENYLVAMAIMALFSGLIGWHGYYGANPEILLMPLSVSLCPTLLIFPLYNNEYKNKIGYLFLVSAFFLESMNYGSLMGSKFYLIPILLVIVYFLKASQRNKAIDMLIVFIGLFLLVLCFLGIYLNVLTFNDYATWKLSQFIDLFQFSDKGLMDWYMSINESPRYRIEEFINIFLEYLNKPIYCLFGKGNGGTIKHLWGNLRWDIFLANYPKQEVTAKIYASMHESINRLFIRHGAVGICFFTSMLCKILKSFMRSKWAISAFIWFVFYWGGYQSWWIGAVMFVICLYESEEYV